MSFKKIFSLLQFDSQYSYLKIIQMDDTRSLLRADTSVLILMPWYREIKNYKELIQMDCSSQYKCSRYSDASPACHRNYEDKIKSLENNEKRR